MGVILKLDFETPYDKVCWTSYSASKRKKIGSPGLDRQVVRGGTVRIKLNNKIGPYFVSCKEGVRQQGDPLLPILFNFIADCLARMMKRPKEMR